MKREIKFRAWCKGKHGNMTFSKPMMEYDVVLHSGAYASVESGWDIHGTYQTVPIMQFTGLKDEHGKEIYEGDVVKCEMWSPLFGGKKNDDFEGINKIVEWDKDGWSPFNSRWPSGSSLMHSYTRFIVIGNIYENKDLLN